jgi:hypothetical protein
MQGRQQNLIGMKFGFLTVKDQVKKENRKGLFWLCSCDCGNITTPISTNSLIKLKTRSCGCYKIKRIKEANSTHKLTKTRTYVSWRSMWARCTDSKRKDYEYYKTKTPIDRWKYFENFLQDMGERPANKSLDRIDNSKGYSKDNCRWSTSKEQQANRNTNIYIFINGEKYCMKEACSIFGTSYNRAKARVHRGWEPYEAVTLKKTNKHERAKQPQSPDL